MKAVSNWFTDIFVQSGDVFIKNAVQVGDMLKVVDADGNVSYPFISLLGNGGDNCIYMMDYSSNYGGRNEKHHGFNEVSANSVSLCFGNDISQSKSIRQLVSEGCSVYNLDGSLISSKNKKGAGVINGKATINLTLDLRTTLKMSTLDGLYLPRIKAVKGKPVFTVMTANTVAKKYFPTMTVISQKTPLVVFTQFKMIFKEFDDGIAVDASPIELPFYLMLDMYDMVQYPNQKPRSYPFDNLICGVDMSSVQQALNNSVDAFICDYGDAKDDWFYNHFIRDISMVMYEKGYHQYLLESIEAVKF